MKSIFEKELAQEQEIHAQYDAADAADDEVGRQAARDAHNALMEHVQSMGNVAFDCFRMALESIENGNDLIDLHECIWDKNVPALIENLRSCGIERFTFSSGWSSAVKTAWLFIQNGCTQEGMTLIHTNHYPYGGEEEERIPAFVFRID